MGVATPDINQLLREITNSKVDGIDLGNDPEKFGLQYFADRLNFLVQYEDGVGRKQVAIYYHANFVRYPEPENAAFIQKLLQETGLEWGTPDLAPDKIILSRQWPDHNRERAFLMAKFKGDFEGLEEKARAIYDAGKRLLEKVGEK